VYIERSSFLQVRQKRTKKAHRGGFEASPNPSGDLLLEKVSKKGKGGKRIVRGVESGEEGLDCHVAYAPRNRLVAKPHLRGVLIIHYSTN
jgi:hypothetical protein